jgi:hypothetical protein
MFRNLITYNFEKIDKLNKTAVMHCKVHSEYSGAVQDGFSILYRFFQNNEAFVLSGIIDYTV